MILPGYKYKVLTKEELEKLPTKRLHAFLKTHRPKIRLFLHYHYCECCGTPTCDLDNSNLPKEKREELKEKWLNEVHSAENYLDTIISVLNTREHLNKK